MNSYRDIVCEYRQNYIVLELKIPPFVLNTKMNMKIQNAYCFSVNRELDDS